jgi:DNA-binding response OmpR family regulator
MKPNCSVLVVEPDPELRKTLVELLVSDGHEVRAAATVEESRALVEAELPCLIVVGTQHPFMPGFRERFGLAREMARKVPVVVISDDAPTGVLCIRKADLVSDLLGMARRYCRSPGA